MSEYELQHFGIKGQRWGIRRYQNPDGSLTPAGEARYYKSNGEFDKRKYENDAKREERRERRAQIFKIGIAAAATALAAYGIRRFIDARTSDNVNAGRDAVDNLFKNTKNAYDKNKSGDSLVGRSSDSDNLMAYHMTPQDYSYIASLKEVKLLE